MKNKSNIVKEEHEVKLKNLCDKYELDFQLLENLLESEKVKRLLKQKAFMQQTISNEIKKQLDEN